MKTWLSLKNGDQIHLKFPTLTVKDSKRKKLTLADLPYSIQSPEQFQIKKTDCKSLFQQTDNQMSVNTEAAVLILKAANGQRITLKWRDFPYTVSQTGQSATITSNLVDWGGKQLTFWGKKDIKRSVMLGC